jgi:hypothetical protein
VRRPGRRGRTRRASPDAAPGAAHQAALELAFEQEVRRLPASARAELLAWLQHWRHRPERVFWLVDGTGTWHRI